jgi:hypothetical protein
MATKRDKMVTAVFRDRLHAQAAFDWLHEQGYTSNDISILMSDKTRAAYFPHEGEKPMTADTKAAEGVAAGGAIGTAVGATLAAVLAIGTSIAVPVAGVVYVIAGPLAAALAGGGAGAVTGGVIGGLVGLGIPEANATAYQDAIREGGVFIGVVPKSSDDASRIKKYFEDHQGESVVYA